MFEMSNEVPTRAAKSRGKLTRMIDWERGSVFADMTGNRMMRDDGGNIDEQRLRLDRAR